MIKITLVDKNCGTGAGGFQPGNDCAEGDGTVNEDPTQEEIDDAMRANEGRNLEHAQYDRELPSIEEDRISLVGATSDLEVAVADNSSGESGLRKSGPHEFFFYDDNQNPAGYARATKNKDTISINMIGLKEEFQGQGYGTDVYKFFLDDLNLDIKSDSEQSPAAQAVYRKLMSEGYPVKIEDGLVVLQPKSKSNKHVVNLTFKNCGTGDGGFQPGNDCAEGDGSDASLISSKKEAVKEIVKRTYDRAMVGWFRNGDKNYKARLSAHIVENPKLLAAGQYLMYDQWKTAKWTSPNADRSITFDKFMNEPVTLYRAGKTGNPHFDSYTLDKKMAERHASTGVGGGGRQSGKIRTLKIKPSETWGMYQTTSELEVLVPNESDKQKSLKNCGTGAGGFQPGNDCAEGDGSGEVTREQVERDGEMVMPEETWGKVDADTKQKIADWVAGNLPTEDQVLDGADPQQGKLQNLSTSEAQKLTETLTGTPPVSTEDPTRIPAPSNSDVLESLGVDKDSATIRAIEKAGTGSKLTQEEFALIDESVSKLPQVQGDFYRGFATTDEAAKTLGTNWVAKSLESGEINFGKTTQVTQSNAVAWSGGLGYEGGDTAYRSALVDSIQSGKALDTRYQTSKVLFKIEGATTGHPGSYLSPSMPIGGHLGKVSEFASFLPSGDYKIKEWRTRKTWTPKDWSPSKPEYTVLEFDPRPDNPFSSKDRDNPYTFGTHIITLEPSAAGAKQKRHAVNLTLKNCGTGAGGFQSGNDCAEGDGSGDDDKPKGAPGEDKEKQQAQVKTPEFKNWFGDSKIINDDGQPMVVYHGTDLEFDEFKDVGKTNSRLLGDGFYFASDKQQAQTYGKNVYEVYLKIENPRTDLSDGEQVSLPPRDSKYDGAIVSGLPGATASKPVYFVKDPNQIKSATGNEGDFSTDSDNINKSHTITLKAGTDCGTGAGGFKPGNDCASGDGTGDDDTPKARPAGSAAPYDVSKMSEKKAEDIIRNSVLYEPDEGGEPIYPQHDDVVESTGFLLEDGTPIQYAPYGQSRYEDHRIIAPAEGTLKEMGATISERAASTAGRTASMYAVMESANAMRVHIDPGHVMIDKVGKPTPSQRRRMLRAVRDFQPDTVALDFHNPETGKTHYAVYESFQRQEIMDALNFPFDEMGGLEIKKAQIILTVKNCGTGAGGFQPGNDCAEGDGSSDAATGEQSDRRSGEVTKEEQEKFDAYMQALKTAYDPDNPDLNIGTDTNSNTQDPDGNSYGGDYDSSTADDWDDSNNWEDSEFQGIEDEVYEANLTDREMRNQRSAVRHYTQTNSAIANQASLGIPFEKSQAFEKFQNDQVNLTEAAKRLSSEGLVDSDRLQQELNSSAYLIGEWQSDLEENREKYFSQRETTDYGRAKGRLNVAKQSLSDMADGVVPVTEEALQTANKHVANFVKENEKWWKSNYTKQTKVTELIESTAMNFDEPVTVHRGVAVYNASQKRLYDDILRGDTNYEFNAMNSFSRKSDVAKRFSGVKHPELRPVILFKMQANRGIPVERVSKWDAEAEVIIPSGSRARIISKRLTRGKAFVSGKDGEKIEAYRPVLLVEMEQVK